MMRPMPLTRRPLLGLIVAGVVLALSLAGAGFYALAPLVGSTEDEAVAVARRYVQAWGESRCDDAAELVAGPREDVLAACTKDADRRPTELRIESTTVELDGDTGTAELELTFRALGTDRRQMVHEELVREDGDWKVAWPE
jgi:hypothetical protein